MASPEISVIVPVYKVEAYLDRCVDSILGQDFADLEILLIDDGSPDNCGAMCDAYAAQDSRVRVIHRENGGLSAARNTGIEAARGEYLCFIDSDDFIEPAMLSTLYDLLHTYQADHAVCGIYNCYKSHKTAQFSENATFVCTGTEALDLTLQGNRIPGSICNKLIHRGCFRELRFQEGRTYEDAFLTPDLLLHSKKVVVTTTPLYNYWHREDSITTHPFTHRSMDIIDAYQYTLSVVKEHCPQLLPQADFRLQWAHFVVLDRMMQQPDYKCFPEHSQVVGFLKKNWREIARSPYFRKGRRLAAVALHLSESLYYRMSRANQKHMEANA